MPSPRPAEITSERQETPLGTGKRQDKEVAAPPSPHNGLSAWEPSTRRCPNGVRPLLMTLPEKGTSAACSALPRHRQLRPGRAGSVTDLCRWLGGTVPAGALPESRQDSGYLLRPWLRWSRWDDMAGPRSLFWFWQVSDALTQKTRSRTCDTRRGAGCASGREHAQPAKRSPDQGEGQGEPR